jgi:hypothetical protein
MMYELMQGAHQGIADNIKAGAEEWLSGGSSGGKKSSNAGDKKKDDPCNNALLKAAKILTGAGRDMAEVGGNLAIAGAGVVVVGALTFNPVGLAAGGVAGGALISTGGVFGIVGGGAQVGGAVLEWAGGGGFQNTVDSVGAIILGTAVGRFFKVPGNKRLSGADRFIKNGGRAAGLTIDVANKFSPPARQVKCRK